MNTGYETPKSTSHKNFFGVIAGALLFQFLVRYAGAPVVDFTVDDWRILELGRACPSFADAWNTILRWPDRPFGTVALLYLFHLLGDTPWAYAVLGVVVTSLFLLFTLLLVRDLTGSRFVTLATGVLFSLLPNLNQSFQWPTMLAYGFGYAAYPASAWCWYRFLAGGRWGWLLLSTLAFAFAVGSYEVGVALPAVFLLLARRDTLRRALVGIIPIGIADLLYMAWRSTHGFGLSHDLLFPHRQMNLGDVAWLWNIAETVRWWAGRHFILSFVHGWDGFFLATPPHLQRVLLAGELVVLGLLFWMLVRLHRHERESDSIPPALPAYRVLLFAIGWFVGAQLINVVSWSGPRLCYVPAPGLALAGALLLARLRPAAWAPTLALIAFLLATANLGTSRQWHESGVFHRRLFRHLEATRDAWQTSDVVLFDTESLRNRLTPGLLAAPSVSPDYWAFYGNSSLLRGFSLRSMLHLIAGSEHAPAAVLDVEHNAETHNGALIWSGWYDAASVQTTALDRVFRVDCLAVGQGAAIGLK